MKIEISDTDILKISELVESTEIKERALYLRQREEFIKRFPSKWANFLFEIITIAQKEGRMGYSLRAGTCTICGEGSHIPVFKSGYRKGEKNRDKQWYDRMVDFRESFVTIQNYTPYGVCKKCLDEGLEAELSKILSTKDFKFEWKYLSPCPYKKDDLRICFSCNKEMYESEMGTERTIMGDGWYPATCPHCGAKSLFLGSSHKNTGKFRIIEIGGTIK